jgi:hypothetical protein
MLKALRLFAFFASLFIICSSSADAEIYQRMLLLSGTVTVGAGGSGEIPTRCLDQFSHQPPRGLSYKSVPSDFGTATVQVGSDSPIPLQLAIQQGIISLEGFDGEEYTKLRIKNLNSSKSVRVSVSRSAVILPDESYPTDDLKGIYPALAEYQHRKPDPPDQALLQGMSRAEKREIINQQAQMAAYLDNIDIWSLRRTQAKEALNQDLRDKLAKAGIGEDAAAMYDSVVKRSLSRPDNAAFFALRTRTRSGAAHVIFTGSGEPTIAAPFEPMGDAYDKVRALWVASVGDRPTVMALAGAGTSSDFDVSNVLLAVAAAGSGGSGGIIIQSPSAYPDPPEGWKPFAIVDQTSSQLVTAPGGGGPKGPSRGTISGGGSGAPPPAILAASNRGGPYKYTEKFERGEATAYARRESTISTMAAAIHRFLRSTRSKARDPQVVLNSLKQEVEDDLDRLYSIDPLLRQQEKGARPGADLEATVDGTRGQWVMADVDSIIEQKIVPSLGKTRLAKR